MKGMTESPRKRFIQARLDRLAALIADLPVDPLDQLLQLLEDARADGARVFLAGNGGSAATVTHMANDLSFGAGKRGRSPLRAESLADNVAVVTAIANDCSYDAVFSEQLRAQASPGDVLLVITGSGNSPNIVQALEAAKELGMRTAGLLGMGGGVAAGQVDVAVTVASDDYGDIEDAHMAIDHLLFAWLGRPPDESP